MGKMTVAEAAAHFNVSKEAIHNRIRRGSLDCVIDHGVKYVIVGEVKEEPAMDNRYYEYIEKENAELKERINKLEGETEKLRAQREQQLIDERDKIEQIYKERDEQLRNVLHVVASKFLSQATMDSVIEEAVTAEVIEPEAPEETLISLKEFLKVKGIKGSKKEKIKARFKKAVKKDKRMAVIDGKIHLDPNRFDYSDLL
jgi:predicted DNA-binding protein YlxM (UPF0122 family)